MLVLGHIYLDYEKPGLASVRCSRCGEAIGRVQVTPPSDEDDPIAWEEEVQGEIDVLNQEHEADCAELK